MTFPRASGVLLHVSSLPNSPAIGDLGLAAEQFIDWLASAGQRYWQILPLGPTGYGDSPYACLSAFAGNPFLISLDRLVADGLLPDQSFDELEGEEPGRVDFGKVVSVKKNLIEAAYRHFLVHGTAAQHADFAAFCATEARWLDDFALFLAIKKEQELKGWWDWPKELRLRYPEALQSATERLADGIGLVQFEQWVFFRQWQRILNYAHERGIQVIGDLPIFVARDSAETWAKPHLFYFDDEARPIYQAGVPPDYFSATGQLWGNPLYRWDKMAEEGYAWWIDRCKALLDMVDIIRIDHFRGFDEYWEVAGDAQTAEHGRWVKGPGTALFEAIQNALGRLPIMAEDLGFMTQGVIDLRDHFAFPGMHILQFAWSMDIGAKSEAELYPYLPHLYKTNSVAYTGTHDNNTSLGWWEEDASDAERQKACEYMGIDGSYFVWELIRQTFACPSDTAVVPMQDLLGLGAAFRMNYPGRAQGNWQWRATADAFSDELAAALKEITAQTHRM